jgi:hypothetical protein
VLGVLKERLVAWRERRRRAKELELENEVDSAAGEREEARVAKPSGPTTLPPRGPGGGVW